MDTPFGEGITPLYTKFCLLSYKCRGKKEGKKKPKRKLNGVIGYNSTSLVTACLPCASCSSKPLNSLCLLILTTTLRGRTWDGRPILLKKKAKLRDVQVVCPNVVHLVSGES
ncbi:hypothetical protein H1C71_024167 [Ictidomys tridecemlineatus]|nr:hypothetical protein H1C71_024167 [Ictidomys tridecemlineatus]